MRERRLTDVEIVAQIAAARAREARELKHGLRPSARGTIALRAVSFLELTNGYSFAFPVGAIRALDGATPTQLTAVDKEKTSAGRASRSTAAAFAAARSPGSVDVESGDQ